MKRGWLHNDKTFDRLVTILVVLILISIFYPLYFVVIASISNPDLVSAGKLGWHEKVSIWLWRYF